VDSYTMIQHVSITVSLYTKAIPYMLAVGLK